MSEANFYNKVIEIALEVGEKRQSKIQQNQRMLEAYGLCGLRTKHFLNSLLSQGNISYLEMGVYRGGTLVTALYENKDLKKIYAVDDWHYSPIDTPPIKYQKDKEGNDTKVTIPWQNVKLAAQAHIDQYKLKVNLIEKNFLGLTKADIDTPIDIVHFDPNPGASVEELVSYLNVLYTFLSPTSVLVAEYYSRPETKEALKKWVALKNLQVNFTHVKESGSLSNGEHWWGGLGVLVLTRSSVK